MFVCSKYRQVILGTKTSVDTDEPVFVLRAQDRRAPFAVDAYASMLEEANADPDLIHRIRVVAEGMRSWQQENQERVKYAD